MAPFPSLASLLSARTTSAGTEPLPALDGLRGLAVLAVFLQHLLDGYRPSLGQFCSRLPSPLGLLVEATVSHAHVGVDLFFVLSGFTLSLPWLARAASNQPEQPRATFFRRRAARLLPAYAVAIAVAALSHRERIVSLAPFDAAAALATHALMLQGYLSPGGLVLIGASWSLTTEVSFYLLFPWLAPRVLSPGTRAIPWAIALFFFAWLSRAALHELALEKTATWPGLLELSQRRFISSRLDQFVLGMTAAAFATRRPRLPRLHADGLAAASLAGLLVAFRLDAQLYGHRGGGAPYALVSLSLAGLVFAATGSGVVQRFARWRWLTGLGVVSYGVFLFHQLALEAVRRAAAALPMPAAPWLHGALVGIAALALAIAAGTASYVFIERPALLRWGRSARLSGP